AIPLLSASLINSTVNCQQLTAGKTEEFSSEGSSATVSYNYSKAAVYDDYFFWYRQYPGEPPEFLISHSGTGAPMSTSLPGFSFNVSDDKTRMDLLISSAAVTDSAVYYCALASLPVKPLKPAELHNRH
uniref:Immunoglobulin V-set domain-containing protein n=1 Tax=Poecilia mexicana TaxID=48701 RepID=A0A3B3Y6E7_9TELE